MGEKFGQALRQARIEKRVTTRELSGRFDVRFRDLVAIEHGEKMFLDLTIVSQIEQYLDLPKGSLYQVAEREATEETVIFSRWAGGESMLKIAESCGMQIESVEAIIRQHGKK